MEIDWTETKKIKEDGGRKKAKMKVIKVGIVHLFSI